MTFRKTTSILLIALMIITTVLGTTSESFAFATFNKKSPFSGVRYSTYKHNKNQFDNYIIANGVDVSAYQTADNCNYNTAKKKGVDFAIIKVAGTFYGKKNLKMYIDEDWEKHFEKARSAGVMTGLYFFSQAKTASEAAEEANYICDVFEEGIMNLYGSNNAKSYLDLPIYMDYEFQDGCRIKNLSKSTRTKCAKKFCEIIKSRGYAPGVYASVSFLNNSVGGSTLSKSYDIWAAQYWNMCEYESAYTKWQYSSSARISGIENGKENVDVNFWYLDKNRVAADSSLKDIANCNIAKLNSVKYTGKAIKQTISVKYGDTELEKGSDYTVGYINNIKTGTAYAYVRGIGDYTGYKLISFKIEPKEDITVTPTNLKKLTAKKKSFKATWSKQAKNAIDGYQIQYSRYSNMTLDLKENIASYKTTSKTFDTNYRKKKYYVRIRTYKVVNGTTYYSTWSGKKTVKVK